MSVTEFKTHPSVIARLQEQYMEIMSLFRFDRVEKTMQLLNWKWYDMSPEYVPDRGRMRHQCNDLFARCLKELTDHPEQTRVYWSGGGFRVEVDLVIRSVRVSFEVDYVSSIP